MGCSVVQRGAVYYAGTQTYVFEHSGGTSFNATKISGVQVDDQLYVGFRNDSNEIPFDEGMGVGDQVSTMDGSPEDLGGGNDLWYTFSIFSGAETLSVSGKQLIPAKEALTEWFDTPAKDLTTDHYVCVVDFRSDNIFVPARIYSIGSDSSDVKIYHPLFDTPSVATYYAAIEYKETNDYGIMIATCAGEF